METVGTRVEILSPLEAAIQGMDRDRARTRPGLGGVRASVEAKLLHLATLREEAFAALRVADARLREEILTRSKVATELERAKAAVETNQRRGYRRPTITDEERRYHAEIGAGVEIASNGPDWGPEHVAALTERLTRLDASVAQLTARVDELRHSMSGNLLRHCEEWVLRHRGDVAATVARAAQHVRVRSKVPAPDKLPAALKAVRNMIDGLATERHLVEEADLSVAEAKARAIALVDAEVAKWEPNAGAFFLRDQPGIVLPQALPPVSHLAIRYTADKLKSELLDAIKSLTLQRLGVTGALYRTLRSTNPIENLNGLVGHFVRNVRRWRDGRMLVRWIATGLQEVQRSFRRVRGYRDLAALVRALDRSTLDTRKEVA